jgi:hypothetical protein
VLNLSDSVIAARTVTGNDSDGRIQPRSLEDPISLEESISADDDGSRK